MNKEDFIIIVLTLIVMTVCVIYGWKTMQFDTEILKSPDSNIESIINREFDNFLRSSIATRFDGKTAEIISENRNKIITLRQDLDNLRDTYVTSQESDK